jgi:hypothetical protein
VPAVRQLLDRTEGRALGDTWLEQEGLRLIAHAGLPVPRCQVKLRKSGGGIDVTERPDYVVAMIRAYLGLAAD